jgi:hypothetical protein
MSTRHESSGPASERRRSAVSLAVLAAASLTFAVLFFQVVRPFALPLFLAAVFAIMAMPLHERFTARCGGRGRLSALLITVALLLLLLGPMTAGFLASYRRAAELARLTQSDPGSFRPGPSRRSAGASNCSSAGRCRPSATPSRSGWAPSSSWSRASSS